MPGVKAEPHRYRQRNLKQADGCAEVNLSQHLLPGRYSAEPVSLEAASLPASAHRTHYKADNRAERISGYIASGVSRATFFTDLKDQRFLLLPKQLRSANAIEHDRREISRLIENSARPLVLSEIAATLCLKKRHVREVVGGDADLLKAYRQQGIPAGRNEHDYYKSFQEATAAIFRAIKNGEAPPGGIYPETYISAHGEYAIYYLLRDIRTLLLPVTPLLKRGSAQYAHIPLNEHLDLKAFLPGSLTVEQFFALKDAVRIILNREKEPWRYLQDPSNHAKIEHEITRHIKERCPLIKRFPRQLLRRHFSGSDRIARLLEVEAPLAGIKQGRAVGDRERAAAAEAKALPEHAKYPNFKAAVAAIFSAIKKQDPPPGGIDPREYVRRHGRFAVYYLVRDINNLIRLTCALNQRGSTKTACLHINRYLDRSAPIEKGVFTPEDFFSLQAVLRDLVSHPDKLLGKYGQVGHLVTMVELLNQRQAKDFGIKRDGVYLRDFSSFLNRIENLELLLNITEDQPLLYEQLRQFDIPRIGLDWPQFLALQEFLIHAVDTGKLLDYSGADGSGLARLLQQICESGPESPLFRLKGVHIGHLTHVLGTRRYVASLVHVSRDPDDAAFHDPKRLAQVVSWRMPKINISWEEYEKRPDILSELAARWTERSEEQWREDLRRWSDAVPEGKPKTVPNIVEAARRAGAQVSREGVYKALEIHPMIKSYAGVERARASNYSLEGLLEVAELMRSDLSINADLRTPTARNMELYTNGKWRATYIKRYLYNMNVPYRFAGMIRDGVLRKDAGGWREAFSAAAAELEPHLSHTPRNVAQHLGFNVQFVLDVLWYYAISINKAGMVSVPEHWQEWISIIRSAKKNVASNVLKTQDNIANASQGEFTTKQLIHACQTHPQLYRLAEFERAERSGRTLFEWELLIGEAAIDVILGGKEASRENVCAELQDRTGEVFTPARLGDILSTFEIDPVDVYLEETKRTPGVSLSADNLGVISHQTYETLANGRRRAATLVGHNHFVEEEAAAESEVRHSRVEQLGHEIQELSAADRELVQKIVILIERESRWNGVEHAAVVLSTSPQRIQNIMSALKERLNTISC